MRCALLGIALLAIGSPMALAQSGVPTVTGDARVDRLLGHMTLAEKLRLIHDGRENPASYQGQAGYVAGVPRLGIPGLRLADGPPGVLTRHPSQAETATMGVAASFDVNLAQQNGVVIGREARALGTYQQRDGGLSDIKKDPLLASLRDDARFPAIVRKLGLPE